MVNGGCHIAYTFFTLNSLSKRSILNGRRIKGTKAYLFAEDECLACMILAFDQLSAAEKNQLLKEG
jgi:hypothetical protein